MKKHITFILTALFAAAVISFGCSDEGGGGEIPTDVGGNYNIKSSSCLFVAEGGKFSVEQNPENQSALSISLKAQQKGKAIAGTSATAPYFYESSAQEPTLQADEPSKSKINIISASVSAGGGLTAQIKYGETTYDCSGTFKKDGETKLTDFNCSAGSEACSFSAEGTTTTTSTTSGSQTPVPEGAEGGVCINATTCNDGLTCVQGICELVLSEAGAAGIDILAESDQTGVDEFSPDGPAAGAGTGQSGIPSSGSTGGTQSGSSGGILKDCTVKIKDMQLEAAIKKALNKAAGACIRETDTAKLTQLFAPGNKISDLTGLEQFKNLKVLMLGKNNISSITPLETLTNLEVLSLEDNKNIANIGSLEKLLNLKSLSLRNNNKISDISALTNLKDLSFLDLTGLQLENIDGLGGLTKLGMILVGGNKKLKGLPDAWGNLASLQIVDVHGCEQLAKITALLTNPNFSNNDIAHLGGTMWDVSTSAKNLIKKNVCVIKDPSVELNEFIIGDIMFNKDKSKCWDGK